MGKRHININASSSYTNTKTKSIKILNFSLLSNLPSICEGSMGVDFKGIYIHIFTLD